MKLGLFVIFLLIIFMLFITFVKFDLFDINKMLGLNKIECTMVETENGATVDSKIVGEFEENKVTKTDITATYTFKDTKEEEIKSGFDFIDSLYSVFDEKFEGVEYNGKMKKDGFTLELSFDFNKMQEQDVEEEDVTLSIPKKDMTKTAFKEYATGEGYICK